MHIALISIRVKPECIEAFQAASIENARGSLREPGVVRFDFLQDKDDPAHFVLYEVYHTPEDPASHRQTAHYQAWAEAVADMMSEPRTRAFFANVHPPDAEWG
jgi:autoinducer 2-degrading protein